MEDPLTAVFVHFMPPPLRKEGKHHLPWIVHTCNKSGCHEAKHVQFRTLSGKSRTRPSTNEYTESMVHVRNVVLSELLTPLSKDLT